MIEDEKILLVVDRIIFMDLDLNLLKSVPVQTMNDRIAFITDFSSGHVQNGQATFLLSVDYYASTRSTVILNTIGSKMLSNLKL